MFYQINGDSGSNDESHVDVDGMAAILRDLRQAGQSRCYGKDEHQHGLQELGAVRDGGVKVHLLENRRKKTSDQCHETETLQIIIIIIIINRVKVCVCTPD